MADRLGNGREFQGDSQQLYQLFDQTTTRGELTVALFRSIRQANVEAQVVVQRALEDLQPAWVLVVGIAGAFPHGDVTIGDVVVSSEIVDFTYEAKREGKPAELDKRTLELHHAARGVVAMLPMTRRSISAWSTEAEVRAQHPPPPSSTLIAAGGSPEDRAHLAETLEHHLKSPRNHPIAKAGAVASSNGLQKSLSFARQVSSGNRSVLCAEMESVGAHAACNTGSSTPMLAIRGISDIIGVTRDEAWTKYACQSSASFAVHLIRAGVFLQIQEPLRSAPEAISAIASIVPASNAPAGASSSPADLALANIIKFGDTDIFPRPFELGAFRDLPVESLALLARVQGDFDNFFSQHPPHHFSTLSQTGYAGFRWAAQLDPLYNAYLLATVLDLAPRLESIRIPVEDQCVFSYRYCADITTGRLFRDDIGWEAFNARAQALATQHAWVVRTDISDFYSRVSHDKLREVVTALDDSGRADHALRLLRDQSHNSGVGLPVGGPASRILAEAYLCSSDHLLHADGIPFCRFVDDYVLFVDSERSATMALARLARTLGESDGLSLQKLKTRVMRKAEFLRTYDHELEPDLDQNALSFLRLRLRYDPYSATAAEDYEAIKAHVSGFDILGMLAREVRKSRVHQQLTKKLLYAARFIEDEQVNSAVATIAENLRSLAGLLSSVASLLSFLIPKTSEPTKDLLHRRVVEVLNADEGPAPLELSRMVLVRLLSALGRPATAELLWREYQSSDSVLVRKECIWGIARKRDANLARGLLQQFDRSSAWERRGLLALSYVLGDQGTTFRRGRLGSLSPTERLITTWHDKRDGSIFSPGEDDL